MLSRLLTPISPTDGFLLPPPGRPGKHPIHFQPADLRLYPEKSLVRKKHTRRDRSMCSLPRFVRFSDVAYFPSKATPNSVGYDLKITEDFTIPQGGCFIDVGVGVLCPDGFYGQLFSRSGLAKRGIITLGGVIDPDYRGSIGVILHNNGPEYPVRKGDAITQLVFLKYSRHRETNAKEVTLAEFQAEKTVRGDRGFGSSTTLPPPVQPIAPPDFDASVVNEDFKRKRISTEGDESPGAASITSYASNPEYTTTWDNHMRQSHPAFRHMMDGVLCVEPYNIDEETGAEIEEED